jgi:hypothetical protein
MRKKGNSEVVIDSEKLKWDEDLKDLHTHHRHNLEVLHIFYKKCDEKNIKLTLPAIPTNIPNDSIMSRYEQTAPKRMGDLRQKFQARFE